MDGYLPTVRLSPYCGTRYRIELAFQCHRSEVNQHPVAEVMPVLLRSGQYALREEAAEKRKPRRSMQHSARRSMEIPDRRPWTTRNLIYVISKPLLTATLSTLFTRFHFHRFSDRREGRNSYQSPPGTPFILLIYFISVLYLFIYDFCFLV
ncbi:hypothetical protein F2Q70_00021720 [Brassica cretica]|uniref:Uncharacterized protein n=1 Tax=Brassica cretica TaxID=69181 RepID=A0A8S9GWF0_BRACR|nr:hypothetical protein F2Q70_00021720 [Brassica cretica]KAF2550821.1 hypothetical protein F2Q68_00034322 [Brassica cretica]